MLTRADIEQWAIDDALSVAEAVLELCNRLEFISNLAHERDSSQAAYRALEQFEAAGRGKA